MRYQSRTHIDGFCKKCGTACESVTIDEGIGSYEYWGSMENNIQLVEVSPCCESDVIQKENEDGI